MLVLFHIFLLFFSQDCGHSRWPVKCCTDFVTFSYSLVSDTLTSDSLSQFDRPVNIKFNTPRLFDEFRLVTLKGHILYSKVERDNDVHICFSLFDNDSLFIICEIPNPIMCNEVAYSPFASYFISCLNKYSKFSQRDTIYLTGFLFHDLRHNIYRYRMPNFLEIHPVLFLDKVK